jgi:hypothetical protein
MSGWRNTVELVGAGIGYGIGGPAGAAVGGAAGGAVGGAADAASESHAQAYAPTPENPLGPGFAAAGGGGGQADNAALTILRQIAEHGASAATNRIKGSL